MDPQEALELINNHFDSKHPRITVYIAKYHVLSIHPHSITFRHNGETHSLDFYGELEEDDPLTYKVTVPVYLPPQAQREG